MRTRSFHSIQCPLDKRNSVVLTKCHTGFCLKQANDAECPVRHGDQYVAETSIGSFYQLYKSITRDFLLIKENFRSSEKICISIIDS